MSNKGQRFGEGLVARCLPLRGLLLAFLLALSVVNAVLAQNDGASKNGPLALLGEITGVIGPASARYVEKAIEKARVRQAEMLILRLDTPGGLATSMRQMIEHILASPVPVIGYVAPAGAHAASAGTYILYATNVAAMAPGTNLGAATPVQIGGGLPGLPQSKQPNPEEEKPAGGSESGDRQKHKTSEKKAGKPQESPADPMTAKSVNDAVAFIRSLAELRGRNADWAEKAVREAASLPARKALEEHVIDLIAADIDELLKSLNGRKIKIGNAEQTLSTANITVERIEPDFLTKALGILANPNIALILMLIGVYGLFFEFTTPGTVAPGVIGAISLVLGLYALHQLPVDYAGLALVVLGIAFMIAEAFAPSFGILGFGGITSFVIGAAMLIDTDIPAYQLSWTVIGGTAAVSAAFLILLLGYLWRMHRRKVQSGREQMIGSEAIVLDWADGEGHVWVEGERWQARGDQVFAAGQRLKVKRIDGLTVFVTPAQPGLTGQSSADKGS